MTSGLHRTPSFTIVRILFPPSKACLYGHINWSLAQAEQQSSLGLSQSATSLRGGRPKIEG